MRSRSLNDALTRNVLVDAELLVRSTSAPYDIISHIHARNAYDVGPTSFGTSVIVDVVSSKWNDYRSQVDRFRSRLQQKASAAHKLSFHVKPIRNPREFPRAPHFCNHAIHRFRPVSDMVLNFEDHHLASQTGYLTWNTDGFSLLVDAFSYPTSGDDFINTVDSVSSISSVGGLASTDWVTLYDKYTNACQAFIPAAFMIGEDIIENDIFLDAFKLVLNPSSAIKNFIKAIPKIGMRINKYTSLGDVVHHVSKFGADQTLLGVFGVRPAINDIRDALAAHRAVTGRMNYLRSHVGRFVPVRVRSVSDASIVDSIPQPPYSGSMAVRLQTDSHRRIATMGCWARVRKDMNFTNIWSAYLQYFGVDRILGLAWELIPFSFVVDWFLNTKHVINYFTRENSGGPFSEFRCFTCSEKTETISNVLIVPGALPFSGSSVLVNPTAPFKVGDITTSNYLRSLEVPSDLSPVSFSGFNSFQIVTGASLILQRLL